MSVETDVSEKNELHIFPNPSNGTLNISGDQVVLNNVKILDTKGQVQVNEKNLNSSTIQLQLTHLPAGL